MRDSIIMWGIKYLLFGVIIIAIQSSLSIYVHKFFLYPDLLIPLFIFLLFYEDERKVRMLFVVAFTLGVIISVWNNEKLGIASLFYMLISYQYIFYRLLLRSNVQLLFASILFLLAKFIIYLLLASIFRDPSLVSFLFSREYIYQIGATLLIMIVIAMPINSYINKRRHV